MYIYRLLTLYWFFGTLLATDNDASAIRGWSHPIETNVNKTIWWGNCGLWTYRHWKPILATGCATSVAACYTCYKFNKKLIGSTSLCGIGLCSYMFYRYMSNEEIKNLIIDSTNRLLEHQDAVERRTDQKLRILHNQTEQYHKTLLGLELKQRAQSLEQMRTIKHSFAEFEKNIVEQNTAQSFHIKQTLHKFDQKIHHALFESEIRIRAEAIRHSIKLHAALAAQKQEIISQIVTKNRKTSQEINSLHHEIVGIGQFAQTEFKQMHHNMQMIAEEFPKIHATITASTNHTGKNVQQMLHTMAQAQGLNVDLTSEPFTTSELINTESEILEPTDYQPILEQLTQLEEEYEQTIQNEKANVEEKIKRKQEKLLKQQLTFKECFDRDYKETMQKFEEERKALQQTLITRLQEEKTKTDKEIAYKKEKLKAKQQKLLQEEDLTDPFDPIPEPKRFTSPSATLREQIGRLAPFALQAIAPGTAFVLEKLLARYYRYVI